MLVRYLPTVALVLLLGMSSMARTEDVSRIVRSPALAEHVVVISIDGLRPDAIEAADAAHLKSLIRSGARAAKAETIRPSITLPSHTSMLTGLNYWNHGVGWNSYRSGYITLPTVFSMAARAGLSSAVFIAKSSLYYLAHPETVSSVVGPPAPRKPEAPFFAGEALNESTRPELGAQSLATAFDDQWPRSAYALTFVHFREPDRAGHRTGWMSLEYLEAVRIADRGVGSIVATLTRAGVLERTAIIVTADHGGTSGQTSHFTADDPDRPENVTIPWICVGPGVPPGLVIERLVHVYDTAPTALAFLGILAPPGIDGRPVREVLRSSPVAARHRVTLHR